jgi:hypothetical protein
MLLRFIELLHKLYEILHPIIVAFKLFETLFAHTFKMGNLTVEIFRWQLICIEKMINKFPNRLNIFRVLTRFEMLQFA